MRRDEPARIGDLLLSSNSITPENLAEALRRQRVQGGPLGEHLLSLGALRGLDLYRALAVQWRAPLTDLARTPPDPALFEGFTARDVLRQGWLPVALDGTTLTLGTTVQPTEALERDAARRFGATRVVWRTITQRDLTHAVAGTLREVLLFDATDWLAENLPEHSARRSLTTWQRLVPGVALGVLVAGLVLAPRTTVVALLTVANVAFLLNVGFKVFGALRWPLWLDRRVSWDYQVMRERMRRGLPGDWPGRVPDRELPVYTLLVPAFHEANVIGKIIDNIGALDYPAAKLDVLLLLEEDDRETVEAAKAAHPPEYVRIVEVPRGRPQTKPRACNYGLQFARGEYVVIYDAEDRPAPDQLRRVVAVFLRSHVERLAGTDTAPLVCVQCALNYFNADYNVLTRMFAVEYAHWFDAMLPGLDHTGVPIPLGGTSNHFDTAMLRELGGWDPYNVTEDADLGLRAYALGFRVGIDTSGTWEEACSRVPAWIRQRTRWIKGYMVTAAVNFRHPVQFWRATGLGGMIGLVGLVLGTPLCFMLYPLVLGLTVVTYVGVQSIDLYLPTWLVVGGVANMIVGNLSMIVVSGLATWRRYNWRIAAFALLNPAYWILHAVAAWRAAWQTLFDPHRWEKTPHGLSDDFDPAQSSVRA